MGAQPRREEPVHRRWQHLRYLGRSEPNLHDPGAGALHSGQHQAAPGRAVRLRHDMTEPTLTPTELDDLRWLAGMIVPPSTKYGVPGADDAAIFADIANSIGRDGAMVSAALATLRRLAGGPAAMLDAARGLEVAKLLRAEGGAALAVLTRIVLLCYYRDDRVLES